MAQRADHTFRHFKKPCGTHQHATQRAFDVAEDPDRIRTGDDAAFTVPHHRDALRVDVLAVGQELHGGARVVGVVGDRRGFVAAAAHADAPFVVAEDDEPRVGDGVSELTEDRNAEEELVAIGLAASGNEHDGVLMVTTGSRNNTVQGNYIGTNAAGTGALGNGGNGVAIHASTGLTIGAAGGVTPPGPISPASTFRNVISANGGHGVFITGDRVVTGSNSSVYVANNYIGTDVTGAAALGNAGSGVFATVGTHQIGDTNAGNLISANGGDGITLAGAPTANSPAPLTNNIISANRIGTDARGSDAVTGLGNRGHGVAVYDSPNNQVGSAAVAGLANVIAFNFGSGVAVRGNSAASPGSAGGNAIYRNSIFSNGRLGIDLVNGFEGVTPNDPRDADTGPNLLQNFPVIASVATSAGLTDIHFTLDSEPGHTYQVEFYSNLGPGPGPGAGPDLDGHAQGKTFIGSTRVATNSAGSGAASVSPTPPP